MKKIFLLILLLPCLALAQKTPIAGKPAPAVPAPSAPAPAAPAAPAPAPAPATASSACSTALSQYKLEETVCGKKSVAEATKCRSTALTTAIAKYPNCKKELTELSTGVASAPAPAPAPAPAAQAPAPAPQSASKCDSKALAGELKNAHLSCGKGDPKTQQLCKVKASASLNSKYPGCSTEISDALD